MYVRRELKEWYILGFRFNTDAETQEDIVDAAPEDKAVEEEQMQHEDQEDDESVLMDEVPTFDSERRIMNLDRLYLLT